jgi:hypothetical protein
MCVCVCVCVYTGIYKSHEHERKINIDNTVVKFAFFVSTLPPQSSQLTSLWVGSKVVNFPSLTLSSILFKVC